MFNLGKSEVQPGIFPRFQKPGICKTEGELASGLTEIRGFFRRTWEKTEVEPRKTRGSKSEVPVSRGFYHVGQGGTIVRLGET